MKKRPQSDLPSTEIQYVPSRDLHLLILVIFEFELVYVLFDRRHLGPVESRRFRVSGEYMFSDRVVGQKAVRGGNGNHAVCRGLVDLTGRAALVRLRVLNLIAVSETQLVNNRLDQNASRKSNKNNHRFLFPPSVMLIMLHCIH